jgi:FkbM family methyltransferase
MRASISSGDTVLDIGANIGFYSHLFGQLTGNKGRVYAFEPDEENFLHLKKYVGEMPNVTLKHAAVSDKTDVVALYKSPMLNVDHRTYPVDGYLSKLMVESVAIDDFLPPNTSVSFIKMDIQGFEATALRGMKQTLTDNIEHLKMLMELFPAGLKKSGSSATETITFLHQCGYNVYLIEKNKLTLLNIDIVRTMNDLNDKFYFNLFIKKN